jgi:hypothetical protein
MTLLWTALLLIGLTLAGAALLVGAAWWADSMLHHDDEGGA